MKNFAISVLVAMSLLPACADAANNAYIEQVQGLGYVAGLGLACRPSKYDDFELLARAYLISEASSDDEQYNGMREYNRSKINSYMASQMNRFSDCEEIRSSFDKQEIFKSVLYGDGSIKTPDGKIITPRQPYNARAIYTKDPKIYEKIKSISDKANLGKEDKYHQMKSQMGKVSGTKTVSRRYGN